MGKVYYMMGKKIEKQNNFAGYCACKFTYMVYKECFGLAKNVSRINK